MVFKPMKRGDVVSALELNCCISIRNTGGHESFGCPCGQHTAPVPRHRKISAGAVRGISRQLACLEEGWLQ